MRVFNIIFFSFSFICTGMFAMDPPQEKVYISMDSGGVLGIVSARILSNIEQATNRHINEIVDGYGGSSAGAINAGLFARGYKASESVDFYFKHGSEMFSARTIPFLKALESDFDYAQGFEKFLEQKFHSFPLSKAARHTFIIALNYDQRRIESFDSVQASSPCYDAELKDILRASASIPFTYKNASVQFKNKVIKSSLTDACMNIPGGRINNPTQRLHDELVLSVYGRTNFNGNIVIYSLGTSLHPAPEIKNQHNKIKVVRIELDLEYMDGYFPNCEIAMMDFTGTATTDHLHRLIDGTDRLESSPEYQAMKSHLIARSKR